jgi:ABC-2 type transport system ATP-binding protein
MIEVENLTKYYGRFMAIEDISFSIKKGEIVGLLGPNAAGKTTTMRILTGFLPPSSGTARIAGYDIRDQSLEVRRRIGYLPETVPLYTDMSIWAYLNYSARLRGLSKAKRNERVEAAIDLCHLQDYADVQIGKLSKGFRQRVGIAQALVHEPEVLILDEPTIGIDPIQIKETRQLIKRLGKDHTIILSTHILPEVSMVCQRVIIINEGHIVAVDTPDNLSLRLGGSGRLQIDVRGPLQQVTVALRRLAGVSEVVCEGQDNRGRYLVTCDADKDLREEIAALVVRQGWGLLDMQTIGLTLEDVFLKLTLREDL